MRTSGRINCYNIYMKYLCIHGHFYQPPRENAWLEEIEIQDSAAPYHDWNARITAECYGPNALARVLNAKGELTDLVDNYAHMSFNFGPTLLSWMQRHAPQVYQAILAADQRSQALFNGHGSAIAQVYNHIIMPLANARDKETQVKWGLYDFKTRFGREPEAMWLAETACNTETLEVLAAHGMKYVILAPGQCARVRKIGEKTWTDVSGARVDPKRAYQCNLPSGKKIALFFYDGPISQGIAFSDTLKSGENFAGRLMGAFDLTGGENQLMHIATDGETYGHHQKFADMALAYCLKYVKELPDVNITVYGEYLEKYPPQYEAQIIENTSWSCFHGVERWRKDCGCNSGGHPGWHQKWRAPLREALDFIRDEMAATFEMKGLQYFKDPWAARNDYIELILDRSLDAQHRFFLRHATEKAWTDRPGALALLEMQRNALLMYTSCGWFFDEISGLETVQILQYACRALELHRRVGGADLELEFVKKLAQAPSNLKDLQNGAVVYERFVKPSAMPAPKVALQLVLPSLPGGKPDAAHAYAYETSAYDCHRVDQENAHLRYGSVRLKNRITLEEDDILFAVCQSHGTRLTCGAAYAREMQKDAVYAELEQAARQDFEKAHTLISERFKTCCPFASLFKDAQRVVVDAVLAGLAQKTGEDFARIFDKQYPLVRGLKYIGAPLPPAFMTVADYVLTSDLEAELSRDSVDLNALEELMDDVHTLGLHPDMPRLRAAAGKKLLAYAQAFEHAPEDLPTAVKMVEFLNYMDIFGFVPDLTAAQTAVFKGLQHLAPPQRAKSILKALCRKLKIAL